MAKSTESDITEHMTSQIGNRMTFLTPGRRTPSLKTTLTRPQSVSLETISPVYLRSLSPHAPQFSDVYTSSVLLAETEAKPEAEVQTALEAVASHSVNVQKHDKRDRTKRTDEKYKTELHVDEIEAQIIPGIFKDRTDKLSNISDVLSDFDFQSADPAITIKGKEREQDENRRVYTTSFCSSSSGDESVIAQSRSSVCDGCSSSTCNSVFSQPVSAEVLRTGSSGDCTGNALPQLEMSDTAIETLLDSHLSFQDLDTSSGLLKLQEEHATLQTKHSSNQLSLSNEQLIFLLLRLVLSKYREITDDVAVERKISRSQRQTAACLIQAIIVLSQRVRSTSDQWRKTQHQLQLIQREHESLRRYQRKIYIVMCILLVFHLCNIRAVKRRIFRIVKFFGIVENVRKVNRFRKMVAENWRNIPSLLTDFWRIFIFRSNTRLRN